jgi:hypothetical protein
VTDAARAVLGTPLLPPLWRLLKEHGGRCAPSEHDVHGARLRIVVDETGGLVVSTLTEFAEAAA